MAVPKVPSDLGVLTLSHKGPEVLLCLSGELLNISALKEVFKNPLEMFHLPNFEFHNSKFYPLGKTTQIVLVARTLPSHALAIIARFENKVHSSLSVAWWTFNSDTQVEWFYQARKVLFLFCQDGFSVISDKKGNSLSLVAGYWCCSHGDAVKMHVLPTCFEGRRPDFSPVHGALKVVTRRIVANEVSRRTAACSSSGP